MKSGIDALITTLRDGIDDEVLAAGKAAGLKVVAQDAVASTTSTARRPTATRSPSATSTVQAVIDVLEGKDVKAIPYIVNKEAF